MREIEVAERRGELLEADEVAKTWEGLIATAKGRLLALPTRIAHDLLDQTEVRDVERILKGAIHEVLEELAGGQSGA